MSFQKFGTGKVLLETETSDGTEAKRVTGGNAQWTEQDAKELKDENQK